jgi:hypothetical protein
VGGHKHSIGQQGYLADSSKPADPGPRHQFSIGGQAPGCRGARSFDLPGLAVYSVAIIDDQLRPLSPRNLHYLRGVQAQSANTVENESTVVKPFLVWRLSLTDINCYQVSGNKWDARCTNRRNT